MATETPSRPEQPVFTPEQSAYILELLGLPGDTTDAALILDTVEDLAKQAADAQKPSEVAAAAKRQGFDLIDTDTLTTLRAEAAEVREIKVEAARQKVEAAVNDAIEKGKITPARKKHWISLITADPAMTEVLASVPNETAVPLTEIGHGVGNEDGSQPRDAGWFY